MYLLSHTHARQRFWPKIPLVTIHKLTLVFNVHNTAKMYIFVLSLNFYSQMYIQCEMANFSFSIAIKCIRSHLCLSSWISLNRKKPFDVNKIISSHSIRCWSRWPQKVTMHATIILCILQWSWEWNLKQRMWVVRAYMHEHAK